VNYVVVFDIAHAGAKGLLLVAGGMFIALGGFALMAASRLLPSPPAQRFIRAVVGFIFLIAGPIMAWASYQNYVNSRNYGQAQVVEGVVSYFAPMSPTAKGAVEPFCVQGHCFSYSDNDSTSGFNNTSTFGGPMRLGLPMRVTHIGNTIIKLEVAR
jgi:hypothetical protein